MKQNNEENKLDNLTKSLSTTVIDLKEEVNNEVFQSIAEGIIPKIKIFIPKAIKLVDEDDSLIIGKNEMIIITRSQEDGCVIVIKGSNDVLELHGDIDKCEVNDLSSLFNMLLDMVMKEKMS